MLRFHSKVTRRGGQPRPCHLLGWLAMARPCAGAATLGHVAYKGSSLRPEPPAAKAVANGRGHLRAWLVDRTPEGAL
ncbi:hypothetical protein BHE74_00053784 [Ensete ventricosum]|nr:hypothetical protein BHE74_00053784 [Ensete ventricosum]